MRITKDVRQELVEDFCRRHGGMYDAAVFLEEVRASGPSHPAFSWFEWNDVEAGHAYRLGQARAFVLDLKIRFEIEEIRRGKVSIRTTEAPLFLSPMASRNEGGGYLWFDPSSPGHMEELSRQAAIDLSRWLRRFESALLSAGGHADHIQATIRLLEAAAAKAGEAA